jgi:hypothetical protein
LRKAYEEPSHRKLSVLIGSGTKLPGVGAPTASTVIHFFHPEEMPIIDIRTVEVLYSANLILTRQRDLEHYEEFRKAILAIKSACPRHSIREIDKALFAFHKAGMGLQAKTAGAGE